MTKRRPESAKKLSQHYYHDNVNALFGFIGERYQNILDNTERDFLHTYHSLSQPAQQLYSRLLMRTRHFVRAGHINYPEIPKTQEALAELVEHDLCRTASHDNAPDWIGLFRREELSAVLPAIPQSIGDLAQCPNIRRQLNTPDLFGATPLDLLQHTDQVYHIALKDAFLNFQLLFFGDLYQDISAFVLRDLGLARYEQTLHDHLPLPFTSRAQLMAHRYLYQCIDSFDDAETNDPQVLHEFHQQLQVIPAELLATDTALNRRVQKWCNRIARQLERLDALAAAAEIYRCTTLPPARERLARILGKTGRKADALNICKAMLKDPLNAEELDFAEQFGQALAGQLDCEFPAISKYKPKQLTLTIPSTSLSVEYATALHFAKSGKCFYVENNLITGMFGLAMWDIIFAPLPGAFYHPFQSAPADLQQPDFALRRQDLFTAKLQDIEEHGLASCVLPVLHHKRGISNSLVNWYAIDRNLVVLAIDRIPLPHWLAIFRHLMRDIPAHRSGLPDLVYFPDTGNYQLLEVKGPGDQLQKNQRRWMKEFATHNIPHAIVNVRFTETDTVEYIEESRNQQVLQLR